MSRENKESPCFSISMTKKDEYYAHVRRRPLLVFFLLSPFPFSLIFSLWLDFSSFSFLLCFSPCLCVGSFIASLFSICLSLSFFLWCYFYHPLFVVYWLASFWLYLLPSFFQSFFRFSSFRCLFLLWFFPFPSHRMSLWVTFFLPFINFFPFSICLSSQLFVRLYFLPFFLLFIYFPFLSASLSVIFFLYSFFLLYQRQ